MYTAHNGTYGDTFVLRDGTHLVCYFPNHPVRSAQKAAKEHADWCNRQHDLDIPDTSILTD